MELILKKTLLYDFYGDLLTDRQKRIYEEVFLNDYSQSEVAKDEGISRQGVHDLRKRCDRILEEYEERMHLVERFVRIRDRIQEIRSLTARKGSLEEIDRIAASILEEL